MRNNVQFYEEDAKRFWDPFQPLAGRDASLKCLIPKGGSYFEYGFGAGSLLVAIADEFEEITAIDLASSAVNTCLEQIRQKRPALLKKIRLMQGDMDRLAAFPSASADVVVCAAVIEHVFDPYSLLD